MWRNPQSSRVGAQKHCLHATTNVVHRCRNVNLSIFLPEILPHATYFTTDSHTTTKNCPLYCPLNKFHDPQSLISNFCSFTFTVITLNKHKSLFTFFNTLLPEVTILKSAQKVHTTIKVSCTIFHLKWQSHQNLKCPLACII